LALWVCAVGVGWGGVWTHIGRMDCDPGVRGSFSKVSARRASCVFGGLNPWPHSHGYPKSRPFGPPLGSFWLPFDRWALNRGRYCASPLANRLVPYGDTMFRRGTAVFIDQVRRERVTMASRKVVRMGPGLNRPRQLGVGHGVAGEFRLYFPYLPSNTHRGAVFIHFIVWGVCLCG